MFPIKLFRSGAAAAALALLIIGGCNREPVSPEKQGQILLQVAFARQNAILAKAVAVDQVFVTVRRLVSQEGQQQADGELILRQPLTIVTEPEGRYAEGTLSVPLKDEDSCFRVTVEAYDSGNLAFTGSGVTCFYEAEGRTSELTVTLTPVLPPELRAPGADVIVFADLNMLGDGSIGSGDNRTFGRNLADFTSDGPNSNLKLIKVYTGHSGDRAPSQVSYNTLFSDWTALGYKIAETSEEPIQTDGYKLMMIFLPGQSAQGDVRFSSAEIAALKKFAKDGGRLILVGEWVSYYSALGRQTFNQLLADLGIGLVHTDIRNVQLSARTAITRHQVTNGVNSLYNDATGTFVITSPETAAGLVRSEPNADNNNQEDIVVAYGKVQFQ